jgi:hypothetical protein
MYRPKPQKANGQNDFQHRKIQRRRDFCHGADEYSGDGEAKDDEGSAAAQASS